MTGIAIAIIIVLTIAAGGLGYFLKKAHDDAAKVTAEVQEDKDLLKDAHRQIKHLKDEIEQKDTECIKIQKELKEQKKRCFDLRQDRKKVQVQPWQEEKQSLEEELRSFHAALQKAREQINEEINAKVKLQEAAAAEISALNKRLEELYKKPEWSPPKDDRDKLATLNVKINEYRKQLQDMEETLTTTRRKADNANRLYMVIKSQQQLSEDKIATLGKRYADAQSELQSLKQGKGKSRNIPKAPLPLMKETREPSREKIAQEEPPPTPESDVQEQAPSASRSSAQKDTPPVPESSESHSRDNAPAAAENSEKPLYKDSQEPENQDIG